MRSLQGSTAPTAFPGGLTSFVVVVFGTDVGNYLLPVFKEQSEALMLFIPSPRPCCLSGPSPRDGPGLPQRTPSCRCSGFGVGFTGFGTIRNAGKRHLEETLVFSPVTLLVLCPNRRSTRVLLLRDSCSYHPVLSPAAVAPAAVRCFLIRNQILSLRILNLVKPFLQHTPSCLAWDKVQL